MSNKYKLSELTSIEQMLDQHELIVQLNPKLDKEHYAELLKDMIPHNYHQLAVFEGDKCIGLSGYWIATKIYSGKYLEMDNVVVDESARSKGIGKLLVDAIIKIGKEQNCKVIMLDAYLENKGAHRFYEREGFTAKGYHFIRKL